MKRIALTLSAAVIAVAGLAAQSQQSGPEAPAKPAADAKVTIAGNWNITMDVGQGPMDIAAAMKLDGKKLTGMLSSQMGDVALEGEFADGKATWSITFDGGSGAMQLNFVATLKDADHCQGTMSGPMGDIPFTGVRSKG